MTRSTVGRLIAKDLYLYRWLVAGTLLVGLASIVLSGVDGAAGQVGQILFVTAVIVLGVFLAIHGLLTERHSKSLLFALSLPISPLQYTVAKVAASLIAFLVPWAILTGTIAGLTLAFDPPPDGTLPLAFMMMGLLLANFCVLLAVGVVTESQTWAVAGIIATNTSVPVLLGTVLPAVTHDLNGPVPMWTGGVLIALTVETAVAVLSIVLALWVQSRRRDFV